MDALEAIYRRRSIRKFTDQPVDRATIRQLLEAAASAPTAVNSQPWEFIVVDAPERLSAIRKKLLFARYRAPPAIVVCGNLKLAFKGPVREMWVQDCSAAMENILIAATALGLGSVWIGIHPLKSNISALRSLLNIPEHVVPLGMVYLGSPAEVKEGRTRLDEKRVFWQEYEPKRKMRTKNKPEKGQY